MMGFDQGQYYLRMSLFFMEGFLQVTILKMCC